ncbi:hypothetical protein BDV18DRAFT_26778 [Aspergillus unguis]
MCSVRSPCSEFLLVADLALYRRHSRRPLDLDFASSLSSTSVNCQCTMSPLRLLLGLLSALLFLSMVAANNYPRCIQQCIDDNPTNSWCDANTTGRTKTECLCRGLTGPGLTRCVNNCSPSDQWAFAGDLPQVCRQRMFPNATEGDSTAEGAVNGGNGINMRFKWIGYVVALETLLAGAVL